MKLLNDIIDLLMNESGSLNEALLKTKVLLYKIGQKELVHWVSSELTGYGDEEEIPDYRAIKGRLFGNITNGVYSLPGRPLAVAHLTKEQREALECSDMRQGLGVLEKLIAGTTAETSLTRQFGPETNLLLSKPFTKGYWLDAAWSQFEVSQIRQILTEVRSRLLDFVLTLQDTIGVEMSDENAKEVTAGLDVKGMFHGAVFGDNVTVMVGHNGEQHVRNTNVKHDAGALAAELRKHGVKDHDIEALNDAIAQDPTPTTAGHYGPAVRGWMSRMMTKVVDASWNIELGVAGGLLTSALQGYYGI
jgi:hypothetical protein